MVHNPIEHESTVPAPVQVPIDVASEKLRSATHSAGTAARIRPIVNWMIIIGAILFAAVGLLAIWDVLGDDASENVRRWFLSFGLITTALVILRFATPLRENQ